MRTLLVGLVLAAAALATVPSASATDLVCLNSGADCVYTQGSGTGTEVCVRSYTYDVPTTCSSDVDNVVWVDGQDGLCVDPPVFAWICAGAPGVCNQYGGCTIALLWNGHVACYGTQPDGTYVACVG